MKNRTYILSVFILLFTFQNAAAQNAVTDSLKRVLKVAKIDSSKVNIYNQLANNYKESSPDSTVFYGNKAKNLSEKIRYDFGLANAFLNNGNGNIILGNYPLALQNFNQAQTVFEQLLDNNQTINLKSIKNGLARSYASAGVVLSEQNNYSEALKQYQKALEIYVEINQKNNISKAYNNIAVVYKSQEKFDKALEYFEKALKIQVEIGEQTVAVTHTNIGNIYFQKNNDKKALLHYAQAEKLFLTFENKRGFALLNNYFGDYYKQQNQPKIAIDYYSKSLKLYDELENKFGGSLALYNLGILKFDTKNYKESLEFATKSLVYAKEIEVIDQMMLSEKLISDAYEKMGNPAQSLAHFKQYIVYKDSLNSEENNKKFEKAEADFEFDKKEALLKEQAKRHQQFLIFAVIGSLLLIGLSLVIYNRYQVKRRLTLQKEIAEYEQKALHLQMNPHFVFNCLGSISSFIVQNGTDSALKYLAKFSKLMRLTLEYSKNSLIPIDKEVESLQNYLELEQLRFNKKFEFKITTSPEIEDDMALPPLLIQPFVENAVLHGLVPNVKDGNLSIDFNLENNQLICTIIDDGIGMSKSKEMKEKQVLAHHSMALEITKKRLEMMQNNAEVSIFEEATGGTKVVLKLPLQYSVGR